MRAPVRETATRNLERGAANFPLGGASVPASRTWERRRLDGKLPGRCRPAGETPAPGRDAFHRVPFSFR